MTESDTYPNIDVLIDEIRQILYDNPLGLSEYDLINSLGNSDISETDRSTLFKDSLQLFQVHFLVFHALYRIRQELWNNGLGILEINPVKIRILEYMEHGSDNLTEPDPMAIYYGDLDNLENISAEQIDQMLGKFWATFVSSFDKQEAMEILELSEPLDIREVRSQYRRLVMQHHPDRGGSHKKIQKINRAMNVLNRYLSR